MIAPTSIVPRPDAVVQPAMSSTLRTQNGIISAVTTAYLAGLDRGSLPSPTVIEAEL